MSRKNLDFLMKIKNPLPDNNLKRDLVALWGSKKIVCAGIGFTAQNRMTKTIRGKSSGTVAQPLEMAY